MNWMYAIKYLKETCPTIEDACCEFAWDYLADFIPYQLQDYIDYHRFLKNTFKELEIEETKDSYIFLSETDFDELYL